MAVVACLGRANYWTSLPFAGLMVLLAIGALVWPRRIPMRLLRGWKWPPNATRAYAAVWLAVILGLAVPSMLREARNNPDCEPPGSAMAQIHQQPDAD